MAVALRCAEVGRAVSTAAGAPLGCVAMEMVRAARCSTWNRTGLRHRAHPRIGCCETGGRASATAIRPKARPPQGPLGYIPTIAAREETFHVEL